MPAVSIVIPTIRGGAFLREAVASVQAQSMGDWEAIIVSDGCEESLEEIGRADDRIRVLRQRRRGVSVARNVGVRASGADLIAFLDDDDRMLPDRLRSQLEAMADQQVGLCHTRWRVIDANGAQVSPGATLGSARDNVPQYLDLLRGDGIPPITSSMVRKGLFEEVGGFDSTLRLCEDFDLVFRIAREARLQLVPQVLTEYRRHSQRSHPFTPSSGGEITDILVRHLCWAEAGHNEEHIRAARQGIARARRNHAGVWMGRAGQAWTRQEYATALRYGRRSVGLSLPGALRQLSSWRRDADQRRDRSSEHDPTQLDGFFEGE